MLAPVIIAMLALDPDMLAGPSTVVHAPWRYCAMYTEPPICILGIVMLSPNIPFIETALPFAVIVMYSMTVPVESGGMPDGGCADIVTVTVPEPLGMVMLPP